MYLNSFSGTRTVVMGYWKTGFVKGYALVEFGDKKAAQDAVKKVSILVRCINSLCRYPHLSLSFSLISSVGKEKVGN